MKTVTEKILQIFSNATRPSNNCVGHPFDYVESKKSIMRELMISHDSGNVIGVISPVLGEGLFLVSITSIEPSGTIVYRKYDVRDRRLLSAGTLKIEEIKAVCPFFSRPNSTAL